MAITPDEIENRVFPLVRRGYDPAEVDDFLRDVASALAQAQGGLATPPAAAEEAPEAEPAAATVRGPDDFEQMGEEVAAILRQAHESVATLRHRAETDAALIRQDAQREADELTGRAHADRQAAAIELEAARADADWLLSDVRRQADEAAAATTALARERTREIIETARAEARGAVTVQRNVRGRLEDTRDHIEQVLDRLIEEDTDLFDAIDLTDAALAAAGDAEGGAGSRGPDLVPPPGQGPPTPRVPPPATRTTPIEPIDLPYDEDDGFLVVDLWPDDDGPDDDGPTGGGMGAVLPDEPEPDDGQDDAADGDDDALSHMVKNAVENALRRRKADGEPPEDSPA
jgi:DivIVA domain-containing protein